MAKSDQQKSAAEKAAAEKAAAEKAAAEKAAAAPNTSTTSVTQETPPAGGEPPVGAGADVVVDPDTPATKLDPEGGEPPSGEAYEVIAESDTHRVCMSATRAWKEPKPQAAE